MEGRQERNWVRGAPTRGKGLAEGQGENRRGVWGGLEAAVMGGGKQGGQGWGLGDPSAGSLQEGVWPSASHRHVGRHGGGLMTLSSFKAPPPGAPFSHLGSGQFWLKHT